jgi:ATP-dependent Lhr-like helicase
MRIYIQEDEIDPHTPPEDSLRTNLVQTIVMVNLLIRGWFEPPITGRLHLSTLVQQVLSVIAQYGGINASQAWKILCKRGPFKHVDQQMFAAFLTSLGKSDLISQAGDGTLILGVAGERMVNHYSFYAAFSTAEEYLIVHGGRRLGSLPIDFPLFNGAHIIFAGKRWQVVSVLQERRLVEVKPSRGGRPPKFGGSIGLMHDVVVQEMKGVYRSDDTPAYLEASGRTLLIEGRHNFRSFQLDKRWLLPIGNDTLIFIWRGSLVMNTLATLLLSGGFNVSQEGVALHVSKASAGDIRAFLESKIGGEPTSPVDLAGYVANKLTEKHDQFLSEDLLKKEYAARFFDCESTFMVLQELLKCPD